MSCEFCLPKWKYPRDYMGQTWEEYYSSGFGQTRDSDVLARSNFRVALKALGGESETVIVVREGHWACGWIEWIAIHESDKKSLEIANEIYCSIQDYAVLDDSDFSELEYSECLDSLFYEFHRYEERVERYLEEIESSEYPDSYPDLNYELIEKINTEFDELLDQSY